MQAQYMYQTSTSNSSDTQNQLNKFRILCNVKDRKITELENRCAEYHEKYNSDIRVLKHKIELSESKINVPSKNIHSIVDAFRSEIRF